MQKYVTDTLTNEYIHKFQVFTSCDMVYFNKHAEKLIISLNLNSPGAKIVLHIINPDESFDNKIQSLREKLHSTDIVTIKEFTDLSSLTNEQKATYYAVYRFVALDRYLKQCGKDTYFTDIDAYIRKDLFLLRRVHEQCDIALHLRLNIEYERRLLAGSIYFKYNSKVAALVSDIAAEYLKRGQRHLWLADQVVFWEKLAKHSSNLNIVQMDRLFVDYKMADDSFIWTAKGDKKEHQKFIEYGWQLEKYYREEKDICILAPRIDHAFKENIPISEAMLNTREREPVRIYWMYFAKLMQYFLRQTGYKAEIIMKPAWEFTEEFIANLPHKTIYVPHKSHLQIKDERCIFYMQEVYQDFFTVDKQGWAASSSKYKTYDYVKETVNETTREFIRNIKKNKTSKYEQKSTDLPEFDVFFPLQIAHDQTIMFHSKYEYKQIVEAVMNWADESKTIVLFKKHPYDKKLKYLDKQLLNSPYVKLIDEGNIHDIIPKAKAVFVANSGVGFEALFHYKPVVTFANAIYDTVTFNCDIKTDDISTVYRSALTSSKDSMIVEYDKFIQWYVFKEGMFISHKNISLQLGLINVKQAHNPFYADMQILLQPEYAANMNKQVKQRAINDGLLGLKKIFRPLLKKYKI